MSVIIEGVGSADPLAGGRDLADLLQDPEAKDLDGVTRINRAPNDKFFLRHHPVDWEVCEIDGQQTLVPVLAPHVLMPGANLVRTLDRRDARSSDAYRRSLARSLEQGWTYIPWTVRVEEPDHLPAGVEPGRYLRSIECLDRRTGARGLHWRECWDVPIATPPGQPQQFRFHRKPYTRWRAHLVATGVIPAPMDVVVERLQGKAEDRLAGIKARPSRDKDAHERRVAAAEALVRATHEAVVPSLPTKGGAVIETEEPEKRGKK